MKPIIVVHRYLGVVLGVIMTLWCLSGFVMMYQGYPATTPEEKRAGLAQLDLSACCAQLAVPDDTAGGNFRVEMLNGSPVLRMAGEGGPKSYDLSTGAEVSELSEAAVRQAAETHARGNGIEGAIVRLGPIKIDQWSVQGARRWQPLWRAEFDDKAGSWLYINGKTGEVVQDANGHERFWNWLGAIPHWLYPTVLRQNGPLWTEVVIWSSAIGCFLVVTGIVIGFVKLRGRSGKWFPYKRPMWMWHHVFGVFAGMLVLTWTFSGLMTMSPWGLLESKGAIGRGDLVSRMSWGEVRSVLERIKADAPAGVVSVRAAPLMGAPYLIAELANGDEIRFGVDGPAPLQKAELERALAAKGGLLAGGKLDVLDREDDYYYGHKQAVDLPVYRLTLADPDATRVYFDHETGEVRRLADATAKRYRWWEAGLHSLDFSFMRARPVWDIIVLILLAAVTAACATGAWLSFTRVGQDVSRLAGMFRRR